MAQTLFILGKGGTGKSTTAALLALELASTGKKTLLVSLDDAHNQSDIFAQPFSHKPTDPVANLTVIQADRNLETERYLKSTISQVKHIFSYLTAFNLDHYFDVLKLSPGMEEYALVAAFEQFKSRYKSHDYIVADMPPTALSLRFFNLPALSLSWIGQLETLRNEIREKKQIISTIRLGKKTFEQDKILNRIREIQSRYTLLQEGFRDPDQSRLVVVSNPDPLSCAETRRIQTKLAHLSIPVFAEIKNHRAPQNPEVIRQSPASQTVEKKLDLPYSDTPLIGIMALTRFAKAHRLSLMTALALN